MSSSTKATKNLSNFVQSNQTDWSRLEYLLSYASAQKLPKAEFDEFTQIYRKTSSHLAYAQTYFPDHETTDYLNQLVIRAHNILYGVAKKGYMRRIFTFFSQEFPRLFYERFNFFTISTLIFLVGTVLAFVLTYVDKDYGVYFLPTEMARMEIDTEQIQNRQWDHTVVSTEIMVNNIMVAFKCFTFGILLGIGTVFTLFFNGTMLGGLAALFHLEKEGTFFWAFILPHGVIELFVIMIAGAAGLSLAYRIFVPGDLTRRHALIKEGKVTIKMMIGVVPWFVLAGIIEGFITPAIWPLWTKYGVALITGILLMFYFGWPFIKYGISKDKFDPQLKQNNLNKLEIR
ncbi:stage II sporulation protein M [Hazenella coriacea]|uniref:Putative membrane protein SpoIIM required for sporulation n=1 Tax=Hazenella coriacea TaxID=1179467 RepID=A0A4R3L2T3_9BACL|nr:stage II sporulation protein M [Hazenella coriacea]TCS93893.1 putative membrane protein SpoIIM required for sporulation [Hazenella coriacea]